MRNSCSGEGPEGAIGNRLRNQRTCSCSTRRHRDRGYGSSQRNRTRSGSDSDSPVPSVTAVEIRTIIQEIVHMAQK
ncbi:9af27d4c-b182-46b9-a38f-a2b0c2dfba01 [Sclerotinia trifoliorum]|uniref:9af27d4c-b182-46b9-a38f-a2b0c2dfba01 n=1 Tax=Sclerotinia trifoliorum TaxID=28548 RepID=A0A8H2ZL45_9HELO|nr:9af27d4c-b182-46b9-a38f-a2b0c2dfba01 [Sclerotinia trifoliorum]